MKILAKVMNQNKIDKIEVKQDLGIQIDHDGKSYNLNEDNHGRLVLSSNDTQLVILTKASNSIVIKAED